MVVPRILRSFSEALVNLWAGIRNLISQHHTLFFATFFYASIRIGITFCSMFWTSIYRFVILTRNAVQTASSQASGLSLLSGFSVVNSIFPVYELFVFLSTLMVVKSVALGYAFLRAAYKTIPLKAT